jgi:hypothetical protein
MKLQEGRYQHRFTSDSIEVGHENVQASIEQIG